MAKFDGWNLFDTLRIGLLVGWIVMNKRVEVDDSSMFQARADLFAWLTYVSWIGILSYLRIIPSVREFLEQFA